MGVRLVAEMEANRCRPLEPIASLRRAWLAEERSVGELVPLVSEVAIARAADVLPGAHEVAVNGETNDDWLRILRIRRVLDSSGHFIGSQTIDALSSGRSRS